MDVYTCILVDDEPQASNMLRHMLTTFYKNIEIADTCDNWNDAVEKLHNNVYDIAFLDINLQGRNGMDLVKYLKEPAAEVIFITAYTDYALDAFKHSAAGYLVKPVVDAEFISTVNKTLVRISNRKIAQFNTEKNNGQPKRIGIPVTHGVEYINKDDIIYLEASKAYTHVVTTQSKILCAYNIGKIIPLINQPSFYQVHRSFIINLNHVLRYNTEGTITMSDNTQIPVSRSLKEGFLKSFDRVQGKV